VRMDANVLWNLAVHDLAIILELYDSEPVSVTASGQDFVQDGLEDVSFMTVHFENGELAHFHASWMDPQKVRRLTVVGDEKMAIFDDMKPSDKLAIHEKGVELSENGRSDDPSEVNCEPEIFKGSTFLPSISGEEPLYKECKHFLECIRDEKNPLTDGKHALKVIRVLEAADRSQKNNGKAIEIRKEGITSET
jgi:predicted dehydrogenase